MSMKTSSKRTRLNWSHSDNKVPKGRVVYENSNRSASVSYSKKSNSSFTPLKKRQKSTRKHFKVEPMLSQPYSKKIIFYAANWKHASA
jgi:hypothetical protein